jgi:hypothetical protein
VAQDSGLLAGSCEHGNEPSYSIKGGEFLTSCVTVRFSRRILLCEISYLFVRVRKVGTVKFQVLIALQIMGNSLFTMCMGGAWDAEFSKFLMCTVIYFIGARGGAVG